MHSYSLLCFLCRFCQAMNFRQMMPGEVGGGMHGGGGGGGGGPVGPHESSQDTSRDVSPLTKARGGDQRDAMDRYVKMASFGTQLSTQERVLNWRAQLRPSQNFGNSSGGSRCSTGTHTHMHTHMHAHAHALAHAHAHAHAERGCVCVCALGLSLL